jgi:probable lipoprotein NlpC
MSFSRFFYARKFSGFLAALVFCAGIPHAAPSDKDFVLAPPASISPGEARLLVLDAAAQYEHTPYRYGGLDKRGLDCSGLVYVSFHDALGVAVPRNSWGLYSWAEKISIDDAKPGDLVFFKTTGNGTVSHVGIFVGGRRFIHSASEGPVTGVMYSRLDERYWSRTYAGVGRVLPKADMNSGAGGQKTAKEKPATKEKRASKEKTPAKEKTATKEKASAKEQKNAEGNLLIGFAVAPTWNFTGDGNAIRGVAGQFRLGVPLEPFGILGVELRSEWDRALGVFRIPLTFSWGLSDKLRFFAGPVLSFGSATLNHYGEERQYIGGTSLLGAAGITFAPFSFKIGGSNFAPYGELAWQSYFSDNADKNFGADFAAGFRFSTGLRCTWRK